jgi:hypothetical protein
MDLFPATKELKALIMRSNETLDKVDRLLDDLQKSDLWRVLTTARKETIEGQNSHDIDRLP